VRAAATRVLTDDGQRGFSPLFGRALKDPDPSVREVAADAAARLPCALEPFQTELQAVSGEANARARESLTMGIRRCLGDGGKEFRDAAFAAAKAGLKLSEENDAAGIWAELAVIAASKGEPALADRYVEAARKAYEKGKWQDRDGQARLAAWNVLRALKRGDTKAARVYYQRAAELQVRGASTRVWPFDPELVGKVDSLARATGDQVMLGEFLERAKRLAVPAK